MTVAANPLLIELPKVAAAAPSPATRIGALDWTKGALIVLMVIYHAINYSAFRPYAFRYLAFLPPSFILIAGFLVGQVYAAKYDLSSWAPYRRLAVRGLKLLLLFSALNIARCILVQKHILEGLWEFAERSELIFVSGSGRAGIFEVLLPIAYFLCLAPLLLWFRCRSTYSITAAAVAMFLLCLVLQMNGISLDNLCLLSAGVIGMGLGMISMTTIDRLGKKWIIPLGLYLFYRGVGFAFGETYTVQILGAIVTVFALYSVGSNLNISGWLGRQMVLLGQYSLLAYLAQIALLQEVVKLAGGRPAHVGGLVMVALLTMVLTFIVVRVVHALRQMPMIDSAYRTVFA